MWLKRLQIIVLILIGPGVVSCGNYNAQPGLPALLAYKDLLAIIHPYAPGVTIVHSGNSGSVTEGGATDIYTIVLEDEPPVDILLEATPDAQLLVNGSPVAVNFTFTQNNWDTLQTLTVSAVDDTAAEGNHTGTITHAIAQGDAEYLALAIDEIVFDITDNDTAGVSVTESGGTTNITEGGAQDTYTIVLTSAPTADVIINISTDAQATTDVPGVTFTSSNWSVAQTITVTAVDDFVAEGAHTATITHSATSADSAYNGLAVNSVVASVTDNETAGISITESGGSTDIVEGGATDSYDVVLTSAPSDTVSVNITTDSETTTDKTTLTFLTSNWSSVQTVTVTAVDDAVGEGVHSSTVQHTASSTDSNYNGISIADVVASITDNDIPAVIATESGGSTDVEEGSGTTTDTITYSLQTTPSGDANVEIFISFDSSQVTVDGNSGSPYKITLKSGNSWTVSVIVEAVDDTLCEQNHSSTLSHSVLSTASEYNGISVSDVTVNIADRARVNYLETGEVIMSGSSSQNITLGQNVDASKAITFCNFRTTDSAETSWATCKLNSNSVMNISTGAAIASSVRYHIVEYAAGVNVQRGTVNWTSLISSETVPITAVDTGSAFVLINTRTTDLNYTTDERVTVTGQLTGATTLSLSRNESGSPVDIEWQVVEIEGATVQSGTTQIAGGLNAKTLTAPTNFSTVDTTKSFLIFNYRAASAAAGIESYYKTRGMINDANTVTFNRASTTSNTVDIVWYLVTMSDGATVQSGSLNFAGTLGSNISLTDTISTAVDTTSTLPIISISGGGGFADDLDVASFTGYLSSSSGIRLDRGADQNMTSDVDWFVVEFLK